VGPYEALRLARRLGLTTTEFFARHTEAGGTVLRTREDGACVFLDERGCGVRPDRPLACRLYPLARWVDPEGNESFGHLEPHPQTAGVYGDAGTIADYLSSQGVAPYFAMGDRYGELYERMVGLLDRLAPAESERRAERRAEVDEMDPGAVATSFFDVDATVGAYCRDRNLAVPSEVDTLIDLHVRAVGAWLDALRDTPGRRRGSISRLATTGGTEG
jgi:hypothetical protein